MRDHAGPYVPLQPTRSDDPRARGRRRARRDLLRLYEPREPRSAPVRRQRHLGSRAARLLDPALLARRDADPRQRASAAAASSRLSQTSRSSTSSTRPARSPTSSCRGSRRASSAGRRSSGRRRWSSTTTRATNRFGCSTPASMPSEPETFGEYRLTYRAGDIVSPAIDPASRCRCSCGTSARRSAKERHPDRPSPSASRSSASWRPSIGRSRATARGSRSAGFRSRTRPRTAASSQPSSVVDTPGSRAGGQPRAARCIRADATVGSRRCRRR